MSKPLEKNSDKYANDADVWMRAGLSTYHDAKYLFDSENPFRWFSASLLAHHALEQLLKSALISAGFTVAKPLKGEQGKAWGHDLVRLASQLAEKCPSFPFAELKDTLGSFDAYFEECRYPAELQKVTGLGQEENERFERCFFTINKFAHSLAAGDNK